MMDAQLWLPIMKEQDISDLPLSPIAPTCVNHSVVHIPIAPYVQCNSNYDGAAKLHTNLQENPNTGVFNATNPSIDANSVGHFKTKQFETSS